MATGGGPSPSRAEDRRQSLTCSLCLDIFTDPRLLPCGHTFCTKCLEDLTSHQSSSTFPCPHCGTEVTVPEGGVSKFVRNFYIRLEDLHITRVGVQCLTHPKDDLDLYCSDCQLPVCHKCVLTKHTGHQTEDLGDVAARCRAQLRQDEECLKKAVSHLTQAAQAERRELQDLQDKKAAVEASIEHKFNTVVAVATKCRDELLAHVATECGQMEQQVNTALSTTTDSLEQLLQLHQRLNQTLSGVAACSLVSLATEMRQGKGSAQNLDRLTSAQRNTIHRPVLGSPHTLDMMTQNMQAFFGTVHAMQMTVSPAEVQVDNRFRCRHQPDTEIFSLCPQDNGNVFVSYATCGLQNDMASEEFKESGQHNYTQKDAHGKCTWISRGNSKSMFMSPSDSGINTYSKRQGHYNYHLKLYNSLRGKADIKRVKVTSEDPFKTESSTLFTINISAHRSMDVDSTERFFAVVEEAQAAGGQRQVKLYQADQAEAMATYTAPSTPFQPADVCFLTLGGQEVLTIADEAGDSIHVVHLQAGGLSFVRYLAAGCPMLVEPTALNTDHRGRLWVACRGGALLTMTPVTS